MKKRLLSVNALAAALHRDRRTITTRLAGIEPDATRGTARLYDLEGVIDIIMQDDSPRNKLREIVNGSVAYHLSAPVDAVAAAVEKALAGQPPELISKVVAVASVAQVSAWQQMFQSDAHFAFALDTEFCRDVDTLAQRLLKPSIAPKSKTAPAWRRVDLSGAIVAEIERHGDLPALITTFDDDE